MANKQCPQCGRIFNNCKTKYCPHDNALLKETSMRKKTGDEKFCPKCNKEYSSKSLTHCPLCGKQLINPNGNAPQCPTCGSYDVSQIDNIERAGSIAVWGLASKKIGKSYKCNKCKHTW